MQTLKGIKNSLPGFDGVNPQEYDFVVIGGGTAGNAVAGRLAENPRVSVLVIEAGAGNPQDIPEIYTPARAFEIRGSKHDWAYESVIVDRSDYQRTDKPNTRGKVLGGSSCANYYTWLRGSKATFDDWAEYGGEVWNWENCRHTTSRDCTTQACITWAPAGRSTLHMPSWYPSCTDSGTHSGRPGPVRATHSPRMFTVGLRGKSNLTLWHSTQTKKLTFNGSNATGAIVVGPNGKEYEVKAKREVIVSAGVFESPKLLMISGIGPSAHLKEHGITPIVDSPHVGQNLLDHPIMPHVFQVKDGYGLDSYAVHTGLKHEEAVKAYYGSQEGPLRSGLLELVGFPRIDDLLEKDEGYRKLKEANGGRDPYGPGGQPHFEVDFVPVFADAFQWHIPKPEKGESSDPMQKPYINLNFLSNETDIVALREGVRFIDDILMNGEGFKDIIVGEYPKPLPRDSDRDMRNEILERVQTVL